MPIFEYQCKVHGTLERFFKAYNDAPAFVLCEAPVEVPNHPDEFDDCSEECLRVEWSVPGWRNPSHGIQT